MARPFKGGGDAIRMLKRRAEVAHRYLKGVPQWQIAVDLEVSSQTIATDLAALREEWMTRQKESIDAARAEQLAKIDKLEEIAFRALELSFQPQDTRRTSEEKALRSVVDEAEREAKEAGRHHTIKMVPIRKTDELIRRGQGGDPRWHERIAWCIEMRSRLLGHLREDKQGGGGTTVNVNLAWDEIAQRPRVSDTEVIEGMLANKAALPNGTAPSKPIHSSLQG